MTVSSSVEDRVTNPNPNWRDNFGKPITVKCKSDYCENYVSTTNSAVNRNSGVYCPECRVETRRIDKQKYDKKRSALRREETRRRLTESR